MLDNHKSIPLLIGVSILFLIPIGIGAFTFTALQGDSKQEQTGEAADSQPDGASPYGLSTETNIRPRPMPQSSEGRGEGAIGDHSATEGIPTGKYSNPPTRIRAGEVYMPGATSPIDNFDSSVERNKQNQNIDTTLPDYSAPSSSNNFDSNLNRSDDDSLITPLEEEEDFLEVPDSDDDEELPVLSPVGEPSTQP